MILFWSRNYVWVVKSFGDCGCGDHWATDFCSLAFDYKLQSQKSKTDRPNMKTSSRRLEALGKKKKLKETQHRLL